MAARLFRAPYAVVSSRLDVMSDLEIAVEDGTILELRPARGGKADEVLSDRVLIPGLVNAHVHSEYLLIKGLLEEMRLAEWDDDAFFTRAWSWIKAPERTEALAAVYRASYLEMLLGGITCVGEYNCSDRAAEVSRAAMAEVGLGGLQTRRDVQRLEEPDAAASRGVQYALNEEEELTVAELELAARLARERGLRLTMHAAETVERIATARERFGMTTVELLDHYGLLGPRLLLSHAVHLTATEMERLAERGAAVVASPSCEMKLADGAAPTAALVRLGVPVALGTDAAVCNNGADLFLEMRTLALLQKLTGGAGSLGAREVLAMASRDGARALGLEASHGVLDAGKRADMVAVDTRSLRMSPLVHTESRSNLLANLVYCATAADVSDVFVAGEGQVREGRHVRLQIDPVRRELQSLAAQLQSALESYS